MDLWRSGYFDITAALVIFHFLFMFMLLEGSFFLLNIHVLDPHRILAGIDAAAISGCIGLGKFSAKIEDDGRIIHPDEQYDERPGRSIGCAKDRDRARTGITPVRPAVWRTGELHPEKRKRDQ